MARRQRPLSREDRRLWESVAGQVRPIASPLAEPRRPVKPLAGPPPDAGVPPAVVPAAPMASFRFGERAQTASSTHDLAPTLAERLGAEPMDRRTSRRIRKGGQGPEARVDLHGMTMAQAHPALIRFLMTAHASDRRMVLVITGKGKDRDEGGPLPVPVGVLRHQIPHWLTLPPLRAIVLRIAPAQRQHGGDGAYYVFLRRRR
jgi:DNA-nicking Smr family endonuclease